MIATGAKSGNSRPDPYRDWGALVLPPEHDDVLDDALPHPLPVDSAEPSGQSIDKGRLFRAAHPACTHDQASVQVRLAGSRGALGRSRSCLRRPAAARPSPVIAPLDHGPAGSSSGRDRP